MSIYPIILSQTHFTHQENLTYPFEERGLQFGDGIYEVIRVYGGAYYSLNDHVERLFRSAEAIKLKLPFSKGDISHLLQNLLTKNNMNSDGIVYLQATRGSAPRSHTFPLTAEPNVYAYVRDMPRKTDNLIDGVSVITQRDTRWENCYIKSLNLLPNVLAKQTALENNCYEAILHRDGIVTECSSSNIFLIKNGNIYTHPATKRILHGCVRMRVEQFAEDLQIPFIEEAFSIDDIENADELFLSSTTSEITPITEVDGQAIGSGKPGQLTRNLQEAFEQDAAVSKILT